MSQKKSVARKLRELAMNSEESVKITGDKVSQRNLIEREARKLAKYSGVKGKDFESITNQKIKRLSKMTRDESEWLTYVGMTITLNKFSENQRTTIFRACKQNIKNDYSKYILNCIMNTVEFKEYLKNEE